MHLTPISTNKKTGPIPVSTSPADTCPESCPMRGAGCYAESGPLGIHWGKVSRGDRGVTWAAFLEAVEAFRPGQLWRHNQAGDLQGRGGALSPVPLIDLIAANVGKRGFTYTHYSPTGSNAELIRLANDCGFTVNLSADDLVQADEYAALDIAPVVVVLPSDQLANTWTPKGNRVVICPNYTHGTQCIDCKLCQERDRPIIGFPAHGSRKATIDKRLSK